MSEREGLTTLSKIKSEGISFVKPEDKEALRQDLDKLNYEPSRLEVSGDKLSESEYRDIAIGELEEQSSAEDISDGDKAQLKNAADYIRSLANTEPEDGDMIWQIGEDIQKAEKILDSTPHIYGKEAAHVEASKRLSAMNLANDVLIDLHKRAKGQTLGEGQQLRQGLREAHNARIDTGQSEAYLGLDQKAVNAAKAQIANMTSRR